MMRLSRARSSVSRLSCCGTTPRLARTWGPCTSGSSPFTVNVPEVRSEVPPIMRMVVDLPAPFGPSSPKDSPEATSKEIVSTARRSPYVLVSSRASITGTRSP